MEQELIKSTYWVTGNYIDNEDRPQKATVVLEIENRTKSYSVKPYCGTVNNGFKFEEASKDYRKWLAISDAIRFAIEFAQTQISVSQEN